MCFEQSEEPLVGFSAFLVADQHLGRTPRRQRDERDQGRDEERECRFQVYAVGREDDVRGMQKSGGEGFRPDKKYVVYDWNMARVKRGLER